MLPRHKSSPTSCLCRIYHSWKLLLHWIFFIRFYTICVYCSQTGAWHWPLCKKCTDKFSFEYFKFVSSLFWHSIIIIINIVFLFYFIFQCYYSFWVDISCVCCLFTSMWYSMYFHVLFIYFTSVPWCIVWYLLKFYEKKKMKKRCLLKEAGVIVKVLRMTLKEWKEK